MTTTDSGGVLETRQVQNDHSFCLYRGDSDPSLPLRDFRNS
jgi:hypothetical protein